MRAVVYNDEQRNTKTTKTNNDEILCKYHRLQSTTELPPLKNNYKLAIERTTAVIFDTDRYVAIGLIAKNPDIAVFGANKELYIFKHLKYVFCGTFLKVYFKKAVKTNFFLPIFILLIYMFSKKLSHRKYKIKH